MKHFFRICLAFTTIVILFSSCGKKSETGKLVPSDALFVVKVNLKSLDQKLSWNEVKESPWFAKLNEDSATYPWKSKLLQDPSSSGIDFDEGLVFFVANQGTSKYAAAEGKLKSEKDFEQFNQNIDPSQKVSKEGDISILHLKDKSVVGWKGKDFIYVMDVNPNVNLAAFRDSSEGFQPPVATPVDLASMLKHLYSLKQDSSLAGNDKFASLMKNNDDVMIWQNNDALLKSSQSMGMLGMLKIDAFIKDNFSTYSLNFENGKVSVDQKSYASKELTDIVKKYMGNSINMDMVHKIPSQDVIGLLAFNFKPEGIIELLKLAGADGIANTYAPQMGFTLDDVSKASNGDGILAFTDLKLNDGMNDSKFNYLFAAGINDKASLQKIINAITKASSQLGKDSMVNYVMNDKTFVFANTNAFASQYLNGGSNSKYEFDSQISGHPVALFFDIHKVLAQFSTLDSTKNDRKAMLDESLKIWGNITAAGGEFKDGGFTFHTDVNLVNKDTNSLKQLNHYFNQMYLLDEGRKKDSEQKLDSLLTPPPIDTVKVK